MIQILKQVNIKFNLKLKLCVFFKIVLQHQCTLNGQQYDLTIIDNAGSDQYTLNHIDFENSDAYILVYAIDDLQRFSLNFYFQIKISFLFSLSFKMVSKIRDKIMSTSAITRF
jgi:GTPase SAR1 family protein